MENNEGIKYGKESKANLEEREKVNEGREEEGDHASKERKIRLHFVFCKKRRRGLAYRRRIQREDKQINERVRRYKRNRTTIG